MAESLLEKEIDVYSEKYDVHGIVRDYGMVTKLFFTYEGKEIVMLNIMELVSGTHFRGMFEERINGLFNELQETDKYILFIDDMQNVLKSGSKDKDTDISGMISNALSEGKLKIIGTTTYKDYRNSFESNTQISRKLQKIVLN